MLGKMSGVLYRLVKPISFFNSRVLVPNRQCTVYPAQEQARNADSGRPQKWIHFYLEDLEDNVFTVRGLVGGRLRHAICRTLITPGFGLCGGMPSCTTCHVVFDPEIYDRVTPPDALEADLLTRTIEVTPWSRLSCQTFIEEEMIGMTLNLPPKLKDIRLMF